METAARREHDDVDDHDADHEAPDDVPTENDKGERLYQAAGKLVRTQVSLYVLQSQIDAVAEEWNGKRKAAREALEAALTAAKDANDALPKPHAQLNEVVAAFDERERAKRLRAQWSSKVKESIASVHQLIEAHAGVGGNHPAGQSLAALGVALQELQEAVAGRKDALHLLLCERDEVRARLQKQVEGARQLELFERA
jgi:uncharacterized protein YukE